MNIKDLEALRVMIAAWREYADSHYCQTYNKERGAALRDAAVMLENFVNETEAETQEVNPYLLTGEELERTIAAVKAGTK
jgi:hypothetical protein